MELGGEGSVLLGDPVGEVVGDELVVVVVDGLAEDPPFAEADRVLGARLDDWVDHCLHLVEVDPRLLEWWRNESDS